MDPSAVARSLTWMTSWVLRWKIVDAANNVALLIFLQARENQPANRRNFFAQLRVLGSRIRWHEAVDCDIWNLLADFVEG